jgi:molecular chaperone DnaK
MRSPVLGIDLGTTNSVVAHADETRVRVLRDRVGHLLTPSVVSFPATGEVAVGHAARALRTVDAQHTVFSIKRLIGRPFRSPEVRRAVKQLPFRLEEGPNGGVAVCVREERFSLPEISSILLKHMRELAERDLGEPSTRAVITVPANFNELQRTATRDAGRIAGLDVLRILNEPTAAALGYGYRARQSQRIAVYDFGGGTFDISILELSGDVIEVIATAGDTYLGGDDLDRAIAERMATEFEQQCGVAIRLQPEGYERLMQAAEWIKCQLSELDAAEATIKRLAVVDGATHDLKFRLERSELRELCSPFIARTFAICEDAFRLAGVRPSQLDAVLLVGGQTRTPRVREMVRDFFGMEPKSSIDPDLAVAHGAALQGYALSGAAGTAAKRAAPEAASGAASPLEPAAQRSVVDDATEVTVTSPLSRLHAQLLPGGPADGDDKTAPLPRLGIELGALHAKTLSGVGEQASTDWLSGADAVTVTRDPLPMPPATPAPAPRVPAAASGGKPTPPSAAQGPSRPHATILVGSTASGHPTGDADEPAAEDGVASRARPDRTVPLWSPPPPGSGLVVESDSDLPPVLRASLAPGASGAAREPVVASSASAPATRSSVAVSASPEAAAAKRKPPPPPGSPERKASPAPLAGKPSPAPAHAGQDAPVRASERAARTGERLPTPLPGAQASEVSSQFPAPPSVAPLLLDVTPHTLCVETVGGFCECIIERNAPIPTEQTRIFTTSRDQQTEVSVRVCQGESRSTDENQVLGQIELLGLPSLRRGDVSIAVTFAIDADGTLNVRALDEATGQGQELRVNLTGAIDAEALARMRARQHVLAS